MPQIVIKDLHLGGISDSKYSGMPNSAYKIEGFSLHEEPGVMKVQQAIVDDRASGDALSEKIRSLVSLNTGNSYLFGGAGAIWKRSSSAVYTLEVSATSPDQGDNKILDAIEYGDSIYYSMPQRLGRWVIGTNWSTRDDNFSDLIFDDEFHPLKVIENKLYIGNKNVVGQVQPDGASSNLDASAVANQGGSPNIVRIPATDHGFKVHDEILIDGTTYYDGNFEVIEVPDADHFDIESSYTAETLSATDTATLTVSNELTLESKYTIQSFGRLIDHIIIGTITEGSTAGSYSGFSHIFNWDLRSIDLTSDIELHEFGINCFMDFGGSLLVQAGKQGNWYSYNGQNAQNFRRFPGDWSGQNAGITESNAVSSWRGIPVIGFSNESGNPALQGVYSFGGYDAKYPKVFSYDFPSVLGGSDDTEIGVVARIGQDLVFSRTASVNHKLMRVDQDNKYDGANIETQVINVFREKFKNFTVTIAYRSLPAGSTITLGQKTNNATSYSSVALTKYANKNQLESDVYSINCNTIQFQISTTRGTDTNTAPEIESIIIDFDVE